MRIDQDDLLLSGPASSAIDNEISPQTYVKYLRQNSKIIHNNPGELASKKPQQI